MSSDTDKSEESKTFLLKFNSFKEDHLKLKKDYYDNLQENKILRTKIQILEDELKIRKGENTNATIIELQKKIIEFFKERGDYLELKVSREKLQQQVNFLENKLKSEKSYYDQETQKILDKTSCQLNEIRKIEEAKVNEKIEQLQRSNDELNRKNEELRIALESVEIETGEIIARLDQQHNEQMFVLKSENQRLLERLHKQEELFNQKLERLEEDNKSKSELIRKLQNQNTWNFHAYQTLDEAFSTDKIKNPNKISKKQLFSNQNESRFLPCITDDSFMDDL